MHEIGPLYQRKETKRGEGVFYISSREVNGEIMDVRHFVPDVVYYGLTNPALSDEETFHIQRRILLHRITKLLDA